MVNLFSALSQVNTSIVTALLETHKVPGIAIGVFDRESKYFRTFGQAYHGGSIDEHTAFRVASLTKPVLAYLLLSYIKQGIFDLDTPVISYMDNERYVDNDWIELVTPRLILSHQTGFPNWARPDPLDFQFKPGTKFSYSGEGFALLQNMMEVYFETYALELFRKGVYEPLGMTQSALFDILLTTDNKCKPHDKEGKYITRKPVLRENMVDTINRLPRYGNVAGTMWASIVDYTQFLQHLMFDDDVSDIRQLMITEQVKMEKDPMSWGLGIGLDIVDNMQCMWHWGSDDGFKAFTLTFLEDKIQGITIFTNGENGKEVYSRLLDDILPELPNFLKEDDQYNH